MGCCPGQGPLKRAREPNLPSSEIGEAGALCAGAHHTPSVLSIENDVKGVNQEITALVRTNKGQLPNASHFFVGDDPEHLPSWRLDIEERRIRVNHPG